MSNSSPEGWGSAPVNFASCKGGSRFRLCESKQSGKSLLHSSLSGGQRGIPKVPLRASTPSGMSRGTQGDSLATSQEPLAQNLGAWHALNPPHFVMESIQGHYLNFKARPPLVQANPSLETLARGRRFPTP